MWLLRRFRSDEDREDVESVDGTITFNYLQQRPAWEADERPTTPVEEEGTTDPHGIADGWFGG